MSPAQKTPGTHEPTGSTESRTSGAGAQRTSDSVRGPGRELPPGRIERDYSVIR